MDYLATVATGIWQYGIMFLLVLTLVVFVHELGHFLVARWCGVTVKAFSIGFGPEIYGFYDKHGTRWRFAPRTGSVAGDTVDLIQYRPPFGEPGQVLDHEVERLCMILRREPRHVGCDQGVRLGPPR